jgi:hypothetical protein
VVEANREHAYRLLLSAGLLHVKWDLACLQGGFSWLPWRFWRQARNARRAADRAAMFHNLAIFSAQDFQGFSEDRFWQEVERFSSRYPESNWSNNYRRIIEASLRGEPVNIVQPSEVGSTDVSA